MPPLPRSFAHGIPRDRLLAEIDRRISQSRLAKGRGPIQAWLYRWHLDNARGYVMHPGLTYLRNVLSLSTLYFLLRYVVWDWVRSGSYAPRAITALDTTALLMSLAFGILIVTGGGAIGRHTAWEIAADVRAEDELALISEVRSGAS